MKRKTLLLMLSVVILTCATSANAGIVNVWGESPYGVSFSDINNFYNSLTGHSSSVISGNLDANDLSSVDLLWAIQPSNAYTSNELQTMSDFLFSGGRIAFMGEHGNGLAVQENNRITSAVASLGGHMAIVNNQATDGGTHIATVGDGQILTHTLTEGVNSYNYAAFAPIITSGAAQDLMLGESLASTMMAYENIGAGSIFLITDQNVWDSTRQAGYDNEVLFENLLSGSTGAPPPPDAVPEPATMFLFGSGLVGAFLKKRRKV